MHPAPLTLPAPNTVLHGDSLDVLRTLPARSVDAVITDPPYCSGGRQATQARNTISKSTRRDEDWILSDNMGPDTYLWWMRAVGAECFRVAKPGAHAHVFTDWRQLTTITTAWESAGWTMRSVLVWDKNKGSSMGSFWRNNHEMVVIFTKGKPNKLPHGGFFNTWKENKPHGGKHPNEKPLGLMRYLCSSIAPQGGLILDPFAGSGTTGEAAVLEGHCFLGIEKDGEYATDAQQRVHRAASTITEPETIAE